MFLVISGCRVGGSVGCRLLSRGNCASSSSAIEVSVFWTQPVPRLAADGFTSRKTTSVKSSTQMQLPCRISRPIAWALKRSHKDLFTPTRWYSASSKKIYTTDSVSNDKNKVQVYISKSRDPLLNLSVEHHLLQNSPERSTVLFLYTNDPCIVIGRNQNPWLEVNLKHLADIKNRPESLGWSDLPVQLVRRRSGGGTVFHDEGNVNFSVICHPDVFDRDKHATMVVEALHRLGRKMTRVNKRHDIVTDVEERAVAGVPESKEYKISGSAYKLTRSRSLHHGTCLLNSPNLTRISGMLRSPAEPFIKARGVESVRSPIRNINLDNQLFEDAVVQEFQRMYGDPDTVVDVDEGVLDIQKIGEGYQELKSLKWVYGQTPRFTFSTHPTEEDPRPRPNIPFSGRLEFQARQGLIESFHCEDLRSPRPTLTVSDLSVTELHEISDWNALLASAGWHSSDRSEIGQWVNNMLGTEFAAANE